MKKLTLALAILMVLSFGVIALIGCGNLVYHANDDFTHEFSNLHDMLDAIIEEANSNLTGDDVMRLMHDDFVVLNSENIRNILGLTWDQYNANVVNEVRFSLPIGAVALRAAIIEISGSSDAVANMIASGYRPNWNICVTAQRSFTMRAGNYIMIMSGFIPQAEAMQAAFNEVLDVNVRPHIFHNDPTAGEWEDINDNGNFGMPGIGNGNDNDFFENPPCTEDECANTIFCGEDECFFFPENDENGGGLVTIQ